MAGLARAVESGTKLQEAVVELSRRLGLDVREQVRVGRRLWGSERKIDVIVSHRESRRSLGLECKYQGTTGTAEEKIPATISDIGAWPIPGLVVFAGEGFSPNMRSYLLSTGKAVELEDLEAWLTLHFGL
ncbi:MAG: hypothetical protein HYY06_23915 [Deltaproteobacteria bacterium]|nr:hypothetical protein [Deltaproteobacteria bacterium]